jgi:hypothetical protein
MWQARSRARKHRLSPSRITTLGVSHTLSHRGTSMNEPIRRVLSLPCFLHYFFFCYTSLNQAMADTCELSAFHNACPPDVAFVYTPLRDTCLGVSPSSTAIKIPADEAAHHNSKALSIANNPDRATYIVVHSPSSVQLLFEQICSAIQFCSWSL